MTGSPTAGGPPAARGRARAILAGVLAAAFAGCLALSLWHRGAAVLVFTLLGLPAAPVILRAAVRRIAVAVVLPPVVAGLTVALPGLGEGLDAFIAALFVVAVSSGRLEHLLHRVPYGIACVGCYAGLWEASALVRTSGSHPGWWIALVAAGAAATGAAYLGAVARLARLARRDPVDAVLYTVGFPLYLAVSLITFFLPGRPVRT